jgi:predicted acetyltransferase
MPEIEVRVASAAEKPILANLIQFYYHDFSEFWAGRTDGELEPDGRFAPYVCLDDYWREPSCIPLLIRRGGHLAGFALINTHSHSARPVERNMAEFFIVRKHRRGGAGATAARAVFSLYPGLWEAAVVRANVGALAFWRKAIGGHPAAQDIEEQDFQTDAWNGPILRFTIRPPGP